mmetsp:Transcript_43819/g.124044  ORF Transcript_43819/g.124044 Transcript_43819/m.124044 type:complete len:103 (+) Transcript_43819:65-373(+)
MGGAGSALKLCGDKDADFCKEFYEDTGNHQECCCRQDIQHDKQKESELETLEAQAEKLRGAIARRKQMPGSNGANDDVPGIVHHYEKVLADTERQITELRNT